ncbi:MAG: ribosome assembly factor SBDS [Candidatus Aenigmatarchaeota archaeon]
MAISVDKAVVARLARAGKKFEILVDPEKALEVKAGKDVPVDDLVAVSEVFEDIKKGTRMSPEDVNKAFGTNSMHDVAKKIIRDGELQLTTEQRQRMVEEKTRAIATIISRNGVNPQTGLPHPPERILHAMEQARVRIEMGRRPEEQVEAVVREIQRILPVSFEKVQVAVKVGAQYAAKAAGIVRSFGNVVREEWGGDGSYMAVVELVAAAQNDLYGKLNALTHGDVQVKIMKKGG